MPVQIVYFYTSGLDVCGLIGSSAVRYLRCSAHIVQYVGDKSVHYWSVTNLPSSLSSKPVGGGLLMLMGSLVFHVSFLSASRAFVINSWVAATTLSASTQCDFLYRHSVLHKPLLWNHRQTVLIFSSTGMADLLFWIKLAMMWLIRSPCWKAA